MIFNNSKFLFLALTITLGACSSLPLSSGDDVDTSVATNESNAKPGNSSNTSNESSDAAVEQAPPVLTPAELEAQALGQKALTLMSTANTFELDKEQQTTLNSSQLRMVQKALNSLSNSQPDKAMAELQVVVDDADFIARPNTAVWVLRGDIHRTKKENEKAINDYQQALVLAESNYQAHNRLGLIYRDQGKFDLAKIHYNKAINAWPGNPASYRNRGILFDLYLGEKSAALEDYKIYQALLDFQIQNVDTPEKHLVKEHKLARQWILDITRQIKVLEREKANG